MTITRDVIRVRSVRMRIEGDDVGYVRITPVQRADLGRPEEGDRATSRRRSRTTSCKRLRHRPAQQSGRPARSGDLGVGRVPRARRDRLDPRPQRRRDPALLGARRRPHQGQAGDRAGQRRLGLGFGNRRRRPAGPQARDHPRHALVRQGLGADHHPARQQQRRAASDHGALLHAVGQVDPGEGHRARTSRCCRTCRTS